MNPKMKKYPKIGGLKEVIYAVNRRAGYQGQDADDKPIYGDPGPLPTLTFEGTVKLHGTNAAIRFINADPGHYAAYQSRNRILTLEKDNAGFVAWCIERNIYAGIPGELPEIVFGEFCGGNIQAGVGITGMPKMFVTFEDYGISAPDVYCIKDFKTWRMNIDFKNPHAVTNELLKITQEVEDECPVAKKLGVSGVGEGVVWKCVTPGWEFLMFKIKGQKHSKSNVKEMKPVDLQFLNDMQACAIQIITPERLTQGLEYLTEMQLDHTKHNTSHFLKYVVGDALREEHLFMEGCPEPKQLGKFCSQIAKDWYFERVM